MKPSILEKEVRSKEINYIEAKSNYSRIYFYNSEKVASRTLKEITKIIPNEKFCRCHRSYIINLNYIQSINFIESTLQLKNGLEVPISRRQKAKVRIAWKKHIELIPMMYSTAVNA